MEPPAHLEREFNDWYEEEHIPVRLALPGFAAAARYTAVTTAARYLAVYELSDMGVLESEPYQKLKQAPSARTAKMLSSVSGFTRFTCEECFDASRAHWGDLLWVTALVVPKSSDRAFEEAQAKQEERYLAENGNVLRTRGYRVLSGDGGPWTHLVLRDLSATENPAAGASSAPLPMIAGMEATYWVYRLLSAHGAPASPGA